MFFIYGLICLTALPAAAQPNQIEIWDQANHAYTNGDYRGAIVYYDSILKAGYSSAKLHYNLGNAYFKDNRIGEAILHYNKAQRLAPGDGDVRHNLAVANTRIRDRIDSVGEFPLKSWARSLMYRYGTNGWAVISLVFLGLTLVCVLFYLLGRRMNLRKAGFFGGLGFLVLFFCSIVLSNIGRKKWLHPDEAIVMLTAAPVKSSPDSGSKDLFILHEGTKVRISTEINGWTEITIPDGNKGWIDTRSIALIE